MVVVSEAPFFPESLDFVSRLLSVPEAVDPVLDGDPVLDVDPVLDGDAVSLTLPLFIERVESVAPERVVSLGEAGVVSYVDFGDVAVSPVEVVSLPLVEPELLPPADCASATPGSASGNAKRLALMSLPILRFIATSCRLFAAWLTEEVAGAVPSQMPGARECRERANGEHAGRRQRARAPDAMRPQGGNHGRRERPRERPKRSGDGSGSGDEREDPLSREA
jgi:hypothetical protein